MKTAIAKIKKVPTRRGKTNVDAMTPLGAYLRQKRDQLGVNQKEMAVGIGITPAYLSALERGHRGKPSFALLQRIIGYLGVIWDEADQVQRLAGLSDPKVSVDTSELSAQATEFACRIAQEIHTWDDTALAKLLDALPENKSE